ncbi:CpsD/CapB family tyrosine-protein kinase [Olsenella sp. YH-ols2221]|uniref:CpsD/CapB family tyrosine-protein kinase n=1 Tax=Olsenella kribbiana TaxID=3115221 RepID=UPI002ED9AF3F
MPRKSFGTDKVVLQNALKTLAANIRFSSVDKPIHSLTVVSSIPSEGKTTVSVGLGKAFAAGGSTVLMVECDMRRRSLANALATHGNHGLYSVLSGRHSVQEAVVTAGMPNLYLLDAEPSIPNPADVLQSKRFHELVDTLTSMYDYVIFDMPPVNTFVDAAIVSSIVDATLLVVRQGYTHREDVVDAYTQLKQAGAHVIGTVLNCAEVENSGKYYDYYHEKKDASYDMLAGNEVPQSFRSAPPAAAKLAAAKPAPKKAEPASAASATPHLKPLPRKQSHLAGKAGGASPDETTELLQSAGYATRAPYGKRMPYGTRSQNK